MWLLPTLALIAVAIVAFSQISALSRRIRELAEQVETLERRADAMRRAEAAVRAAQAEPTAEPHPTHVSAPLPKPPAEKVVAAAREPAPSITAPVAAPVEPARSRGLDFEELFGRRLAIWVGGGVLALAGFFIVKYAIDLGLVSPAVRVTMGLLFGLSLIGGAEVARRNAERVRDPRVAQALGGAGIASLYASILLAAQLYHLIPPLAAFAAMAVITAGALAAAVRFGPPSAILGLIGGFATPALVGGSPGNTPLLILYLCLVIAGLSAVSRGQRWPWLAIGALIGGFGWGLVLIVAGMLDTSASLAFGVMLLVLGVATPLVTGAAEGRQRHGLQLAGALGAAGQAALLVVSGGFEMLHWGIYGLIGAALVWLAMRDRGLRLLPAVALLVGLLALLPWFEADALRLFTVLGGMAVIFGVPAGLALWRQGGGLLQAGQIAALLLLGWLAAALHTPNLAPFVGGPGWLALVFGAVAGGLAALGWRHPERGEDGRFALLAVTAAVLAALAICSLQPTGWPAWIAGVAAALLALRAFSGDRRLGAAAGIFTGLTALNLIVPPLAHQIVMGNREGGFGVLGNVLTSLTARPVLTEQVAQPALAALWLGLPAVILLAGVWASRRRLPDRLARFAGAAAGVMAVATVFAVIKHGFGIEEDIAFRARGLLERVAFDQLLFAVGAVLLGRGRRIAGWIFTGAATARAIGYSLLLFNPAVVSQHVGALPVVNLLGPALLAPVVWLALALRREAAGSPLHRPVNIAQMALLVGWAMLAVRQLFSGSLLVGAPISGPESIGYSLAAIATALGMLVWGVRRRDRPWRVASLVLMVLAVGKVFLFDTAGLEGLLRIASFVALGFSLIGIGWVYGRFLKRDETDPAT